MGRPYCFDALFQDGSVGGDFIGLQVNAVLGVDCHFCTAGSIISEAKLSLQYARNHYNEYHMEQAKTRRSLLENLGIKHSFNLATIKWENHSPFQPSRY